MEKEYITKNREAYNQFAIQHNNRLNIVAKEDLDDDYWINLIKNKLLTQEFNNVLEIGPGSGRMLRIFEDNFQCRTTAVELSSEMIKYAKIQSPKTVFIEDNILNLSFSPKTFNIIFMGAIIHNFPKEDGIELLKRVHTWLTDDGRVLIYTTIHEKSSEGYSEKVDYTGNIVRFRKKFTEEELKSLLTDLNFNIIHEVKAEESTRNKKWLTYVLEKNVSSSK